jgi:hypothetical protein
MRFLFRKNDKETLERLFNDAGYQTIPVVSMQEQLIPGFTVLTDDGTHVHFYFDAAGTLLEISTGSIIIIDFLSDLPDEVV